MIFQTYKIVRRVISVFQGLIIANCHDATGCSIFLYVINDEYWLTSRAGTGSISCACWTILVWMGRTSPHALDRAKYRSGNLCSRSHHRFPMHSDIYSGLVHQVRSQCHCRSNGIEESGWVQLSFIRTVYVQGPPLRLGQFSPGFHSHWAGMACAIPVMEVWSHTEKEIYLCCRLKTYRVFQTSSKEMIMWMGRISMNIMLMEILYCSLFLGSLHCICVWHGMALVDTRINEICNSVYP